MTRKTLAKERKTYPAFVFSGMHYGCRTISWSTETNISKLIELCTFNACVETPKVNLYQKTDKFNKEAGTPLYERVGFVNINLGTLEKGDGAEMFIRGQCGNFNAKDFMKYGIKTINAE
ncbi:MAG: hypothetical protein FWC08_13385 [Defluviitaleaceae bacterium]|nr:hypothetical protein [Defluviitaleaceae bacterium]